MRSLVWFFYVVAFHVGIIDLFYRRNRYRARVITYHNVLPDRFFDDSLHLRLCHRESAFIRQMQIAAERWPVAENSQAPECQITFDDGYQNNYAVVAPILERYGLRGTFFVTLDLLENQNVLWPDRFITWLSLVPSGTYHLRGRSVDIHDTASRAACWTHLWNEIVADYRCLGDVGRELEAAYAFERLPLDPEFRRLRLTGMTTAELEELSGRGHQIACHSYRHDILARLSDAALDDDFRRCEEALGRIYNCASYAYPFGGAAEVTERERQACRRSRFESAFLNVDLSDAEGGKPADRYAMPRITLPDTSDRYVIEAKLSGFESALKALAAKLSRVAGSFDGEPASVRASP